MSQDHTRLPPTRGEGQGLLPCPFCSGVDIGASDDTETVFCRSCGAMVVADDAALDIAQRRWNTRPAPLRALGATVPAKLGNTPTADVLAMSADMLDEAAQRLGGLVDMPVMARKLRELRATLTHPPGGNSHEG